MASTIDPTKPADGVLAVKEDLRNNLQTAKSEIEALQAATGLSAAAYGVVADGVTNNSAALEAAMVAAAVDGSAVILPPGDILLGSQITHTIQNKAILKSFGGTTVHINPTDGDGAILFEAPTVLSTTLASDADAGATSIEVTSAVGVALDDLLHFNTSTAVEGSWFYDKNCVRRVIDVVGTTIFLDQPLDFFFTTAEATTVAFFSPRYVYIDGVDFYAYGGKFIRFRRLSGGLISNGLLEGPVPGQDVGFSDGFYTTTCDNITYDRLNFKKLRYAPVINTGSRNTVVKNCYADQVRHLDPSAWSQDTLFENIVGIATHGLIQSHPSIRNTFRNVRDNVTQPGLYGLDLRGLGEVVEDCSSYSINGVGGNTNRAGLNPDYIELGQTYTRRITRFKSPTAVIGCGNQGKIIIEDCDVPGIALDGNLNLGEAYVSPRTLSGFASASGISAGINRLHHRQDPILLDIRVDDSYASNASPTAITGVTQASPGVVTSTAHGLANGDVFRVTNPTGMNELDYNFYKAANVTTNTFEINDTDDSPLDTTTFVAYTSGGFVTRHKSAKKLDRSTNLHIGRFPFAYYRAPKLGDGASTISMMITTETGGLIRQKDRFGEMTIRCRSASGLTTYVYSYRHEVFPGTTPTLTELSNSAIGTAVTVTVSNETKHFDAEIQAEGGTGVSANATDAYWSFDIAISVTVTDFEIEIKEWVDPTDEFPVIP